MTARTAERWAAPSSARDLDGFSLHAATCVAADRTDRREHLIRYVARPPIANDRLAVLPDGRISFALKKRWRDGSTLVVLDPLTFLERLCALVPRPHKKLVTYHGVFAPAAGYRDRVVPERSEAAPCRHLPSPGPQQEPPPAIAADSPPPPPPRRPRAPHVLRRKPPLRRRYYPWAELSRRVFGTEVLVCPHCGGARRLLTFLTDQDVIRNILRHLGLPTEPRFGSTGYLPVHTPLAFSRNLPRQAPPKRAGNRWCDGVPPPPSIWLGAPGNAQIVRDANGNALVTHVAQQPVSTTGYRLPAVAVGENRYIAFDPSFNDGSFLGWLRAIAGGHVDLTGTFTNHANYVALVTQHAYGLQALGYLLQADADAIIQRAILSNIGN